MEYVFGGFRIFIKNGKILVLEEVGKGIINLFISIVIFKYVYRKNYWGS